jgi:5-formyltetrahydrofolate cyclo-ligase
MNPQKAAIRKRVRAARDATSVEQRAMWTRRICEKALALPAYQSSRTIHIFLSFQSEVDTRAIIEDAFTHGKRVAVPVFLKDSNETPCTEILSLSDDQFHFGKWDLRTPRVPRPVPIEAIALVFVPLVAFGDPTPTPAPVGQGHRGRIARIGYGAGYYDAFLARLHPDVPKIGLAFSMQRVDAIPLEPWDVLLDGVITETGPQHSHAR